jgi:integrase
MDVTTFGDALRGRGLADSTVSEYVKLIRRLAQHARDIGVSLPDLSALDIRAWVDTLPPGWASRKQARMAVHHYYRLGGRTDEPWEAIKVPQQPRPRYRGLEPADAHTLRDAALMVGGNRGLAVLVGLYTGGRASEIAGLRWDGVDRGAGIIRWWRTKTQEWHEVPLHPQLGDALAKARRTGHPHVFPGERGREHVSAQTIWSWVRSLGQMAGVKVTPHQLRSTAGTRVLEVTRDLDAAAEFLGHRDPAITRRFYTRTSTTRLRAAVDALDYD